MSALEGITFKRKGNIVNQQFVKFFLPMVLMAMSSSFASVIDGIIVGNILGTEALAAVNIVMPVYLLFMMAYMLVGVGGSTMYSKAIGEMDQKRAREIFTFAVLFLVSIVIFICVMGNVFCDSLTEMLTKNAPNLRELTKEYLRITINTCPFFILTSGLGYFVQAAGNAKLVSVALIVANALNLALDIIFMGMLGMGIGGTALATGVGCAVGFLFVLYGLWREKTLRMSSPSKDMLKQILPVLKNGLPITIDLASNFLRMLCINLIVMKYLGSDGVVVFSVCLFCQSLVLSAVEGSEQTLLPLMGTLYGEKDFKGIRFTIKKAITFTLFASLLLMLIFELFPVQIISAFGVSNPAQVAIAVEALRIFATSLPFAGLFFIFITVYQIIGYQQISGWIAFFEGFGAIVPVAILLANIVGISGMWLAFPIGEILTLAGLCLTVKLIHRRNPKAKGLFLLDDTLDGAVMDITATQETLAAVELSRLAIEFCKAHGADDIAGNHAGIVLEEITVNTIKHRENRKKTTLIDVRMIVEAEKITIIFKDNGAPFDPLKEREDPKEFGSITVVKAISMNISYDYIIGMNRTVVKLNFEKHENERSISRG